MKKKTSSLQERSNFYVNLPSNVTGLTANNTPSRFSVLLPQRIKLDGKWEVGLADIFIPSYGFNIKPPLMSSLVVYSKGGRDAQGVREHVRVRIPEGRYKPWDYVKMFNKLVEELGIVKSRLRYDEHANRITFVVAHGEVMSVDNVKLRRMFGMRRSIYALMNDQPGKKSYVIPKPCNFNVNGTTMFVYSDVAESSPVGNIFAPLLRKVHLEIDEKMDTLHKMFSPIHYYPVRTSDLRVIVVRLTNVYGDDMVFYGGESVLVLHFRKCS